MAMEFLGLSPEGTTILAMGLAVIICLLVVLGVYFWIRKVLRAWVERTGTSLDDQILVRSENSLLPLVAMGTVYLLFSFAPLPPEFAPTGKRILLAGIIVLALIVATRRLLLLLERLGARYGVAKNIAQGGHGPIRALAIVLVIYILPIYFLDLSESTEAVLRPVMRAALILFFAWLLMRGVALAAHLIWRSYSKRLQDIEPGRARSFETLIGIAQYVASFVVVLIAAGAALSQFTFFQTLAGSLLASAGIAGIVLGLAAQRSLGNVFAGIQLALAQPVRLGDAVVFEGEWGVVEEISLSHVVIRIWDLRRLIVPITYLLDRPIQNWTRVAPELTGTVYVYTDYQVDVEAVRKELDCILHSTPLWNRKVPSVLQVTDCKQDTVELRALCSAADAATAWDLRCFVREKLLTYLQNLEDGKFLPRTRVELNGGLERTALFQPSSSQDHEDAPHL